MTITPGDMKQCPDCKDWVPVEDYYIQRHNDREYPMTYCKPCHIERCKARARRKRGKK
jgi:hypothetical protein